MRHTRAGTGRTTVAAIAPAVVVVVVLLLLAALPAHAVTGDGDSREHSTNPSPVFEVHFQPEALILAGSVAGGIRLSPSAALLLHGEGGGGLGWAWAGLAGARFSPLLRAERRIDLEILGGVGDLRPLSAGWLVFDEASPVYAVVRLDSTFLTTTVPRGAVAPIVRLETQLQGVERAVHHENRSVDRTRRLDWKGLSLFLGGLIEADVSQAQDGTVAHHLQWRFWIGATFARGGVVPNPHLAITFGYVRDSRPEKAVPPPRSRR